MELYTLLSFGGRGRIYVGDGFLTIVAKNQSVLDKLMEKIHFTVGCEIEKGGVYKGVVTSIKEYGAFVEFNGGQQGLLHISELSHEPIRFNPKTDGILRHSSSRPTFRYLCLSPNTRKRVIMEFCEKSGIEVKQYLPYHKSREDWMRHFGPKWDVSQEMKMKFDPKMILSPGQRVLNLV